MTKRTRDFLSLHEGLKEMLTENNLEKGIAKVEAEQAWQEVMGSGVMSYTTSVTFKNGTLVVKLSSATLREELSYGKEKILSMLNARLGASTINNIKLT